MKFASNLQNNIEKTIITGVTITAAIVFLNQSFEIGKNIKSATNFKNSTNHVKASSKVKAFLATIRYAEGTAGPNGYKTMFTGKQFSSFAKHPRQLQCTFYAGKRLCSDAAGAYQFLSTTWEPLGFKDFSPANQDKGAIELLRRGGVLHLVEAGKFEQAIYQASQIWASLPNRYGGSAYNQPVKPIQRLRQIYEQNLE